MGVWRDPDGRVARLGWACGAIRMRVWRVPMQSNDLNAPVLPASPPISEGLSGRIGRPNLEGGS
jgi:hypothetical protein